MGFNQRHGVGRVHDRPFSQGDTLGLSWRWDRATQRLRGKVLCQDHALMFGICPDKNQAAAAQGMAI
jgi:hypothetical protein